MYLVGTAPIGDGVEVLRQQRVAERHDLLVQRVGRERGVVGRGAATNEEQRVARVLAELGVGGDRGRGGGEGAEEVMVVGGRDDATAARPRWRRRKRERRTCRIVGVGRRGEGGVRD